MTKKRKIKNRCAEAHQLEHSCFRQRIIPNKKKIIERKRKGCKKIGSLSLYLASLSSLFIHPLTYIKSPQAKNLKIL